MSIISLRVLAALLAINVSEPVAAQTYHRLGSFDTRLRPIIGLADGRGQALHLSSTRNHEPIVIVRSLEPSSHARPIWWGALIGGGIGAFVGTRIPETACFGGESGCRSKTRIVLQSAAVGAVVGAAVGVVIRARSTSVPTTSRESLCGYGSSLGRTGTRQSSASPPLTSCERTGDNR